MLLAFSKVRGPKLEELDLKVRLLRSEAAAIEKHCGNLRRLKFGRSLYNSSNCIWRGQGTSVRDLEIVLSGQQYEFPRTNWPGNFTRLSTLSLCVPPNGRVDGRSVVDICSKFGSDLRVLNLKSGRLNAEHFRKLREVCPDADIDVDFFSNTGRANYFSNEKRVRLDADSYVAMGKAAWSLHAPRDSDIIEKLGDIGRACPNLRELSFYTCDETVERFRDLFVEPKPRLRKICLDVFHNFASPAMGTIFQVLTGTVPMLEHFEYDGPAPPLRMLPPFLAANQKLRKVKLELSLGVESPCLYQPPHVLQPVEESEILRTAQMWESVMMAFLQNRGLLELDCSCDDPYGEKHADYAEFCAPARFGSTSVSMCYAQYF